MAKKGTGKFAIGAIVGAVVGVVAGILTAPKSGKETRADIKKKSDKLVDDTKLGGTVDSIKVGRALQSVLDKSEI